MHWGLYSTALEFISKYHSNQKDLGGNPYSEHLERVSKSCITADGKLVALLHDILEDTDCTEEILKKNFPNSIVETVKLLTRKKGENYKDYINRVATNPIAVEVKFADLKDNLDVLRLGRPITEKDLHRLNKYIESYNFLKTLNYE